jgi:hypothetical protein
MLKKLTSASNVRLTHEQWTSLRLARLQELLAMLQAANEVASATESGDVSRLLADLDVMSAGGLAHPPLDTADRGARVATGHRLLLNHRRHP